MNLSIPLELVHRLLEIGCDPRYEALGFDDDPFEDLADAVEKQGLSAEYRKRFVMKENEK